jgi:peptidyl-prolyl cis-trans isomerase A (cyclophilin A)
MRSIVLILALIGCGNSELESENSELKSQVAKLQKSETALKEEVEGLRTKLATSKRALAALKLAENYRALGIEPGGELSARFHTSLGQINCNLMPDVAPKTVLNFVQLAEGSKDWTDPKTKQAKTGPLYNGTVFHRVIPKFMIQGGDPMGTGRGGPGYRFEDETTPDVVFDAPGLLAMANAGPNTNGSQFFITDRSTPSHLNGKHTIFGRCENLDVVEAIASTERGGRDKPKVDVVLKRLEIRR